MIDWRLAGRVARSVAGLPAAGDADTRELPAIATDAAQRVSAYTGLRPAVPPPGPEAVDRPAWIVASHANARGLLEPALERLGGARGEREQERKADGEGGGPGLGGLLGGLGPLGGPARAAAGSVVGAEVGALTGFLARRVLGQYDVDLLGSGRPPRLLIVAPNVAEAARRLSVDEGELLRWVTIHEVTHAVQFGSVPWLREHLGGLIGELLEGLEATVEGRALLRLPSLDDMRALAEAARGGDLVSFAVGPERRALLDRIQATMAVVEGHAEHVMDAAGVEVLPSLPRLRAALDRRRTSGPLAVRLLMRLLGLEAKMRQYVVGKRFCDAVVEARGPDALALVFSEPAALPSADELDDPPAWLARVA